MPAPIFVMLLLLIGVPLAILILMYVVAPLLRGIGSVIAGVFKGIGWLIAHLVEFIGGMIGDSLRFIGAILALVVFMPLAFLSVVAGRWSAAGHFAESVKRECSVAGRCLYRVGLRRPLKLLWLHGILEGVEQRVPAAMAAAPAADRPSKRVGQFPGYSIVGSLKAGGSGAKLYIAEPDAKMLKRYPTMPDRVVIKCFALSEGSALPQIVRESRTLESAKQLGLVFDHGMDDRRFYYVMPYHAGDHLGIVTRQLHGESGEAGLERPQLAIALQYVGDLVSTLDEYHNYGLWHKDVKPENVIVHGGAAHLVDLGLVTPLRSAMTLTTHGTEYFRDPELVRQALRGVKVHQVNGAKFDIYAAGAVLYFVIENTFPAHGALSRFQRRSPEALRWVVRRAMADYQHRYESASMMLADLHHISAAADAYAVKPADLPSMNGAASVARPPRVVATPAPAALHASVGRDEERVDHVAASAGPPSPAGLPKIRVTNWWTGAYAVEGVDVAEPASVMPRVSPAERAAVSDLRHDEQDLRQKVRSGVLTPSKAAKEQIRAARSRAKEARRRAHDHRRRVLTKSPAERQPSFALVAVAAFMVVGLIGIGFAIKNAASRPSVEGWATVGGGQSAERAGVPAALPAATANAEPAAGPPVLFVPDIMNGAHPAVSHALTNIMHEFAPREYELVIPERAMDGGLLGMVRSVRAGDELAMESLESFMERHGLAGILSVVEHEDYELDAQLITSDAPGALARTFDPAGAAFDPTPAVYLLFNDHPADNSAAVADELARRIAEAHMLVESDLETEATLRAALPALAPGHVPTLTPKLQTQIREAGYSGVLYVTAPPLDQSDEVLTLHLITVPELAEAGDDAAADTSDSGAAVDPGIETCAAVAA